MDGQNKIVVIFFKKVQMVRITLLKFCLLSWSE